MGVWGVRMRELRRIAGSAAVGTALIAGAPVAAQTMSTPNLPGVAPTISDGLSLNASGEVLYDSNVLRTASLAVLTGTTHRDDFRYSPEASATYGRSSGLIALSVNGSIGRDFFQYNRYLDRNRYLGGGLVTYHAGSSCQVSVNGNYASRQGGIREAGAAIIDPAGAPADDVGIVIDNVITTAVYGANAGCGSPTGRLTFGGGYTHSSISNGAALRKFGDSDSDTFMGNVGLGIFRPGQLSLNGSYSTIEYPNRIGGAILNGAPLVNSGVKTYRIGLSYSRPIGTKLSGSFGVAFLHSDPIGGQAAYNSPAYNLGLNYAPSQRLNFTLTGSRDIIPSTTAGALFRVVDQLLLGAHYSLGNDITVDGNAGFIRNNYKQAFSLPGEPVRNNDISPTFGLGVTYAPRSLYDVTVNVTRTSRTSDPAIYNYSSTRAGITLAVHF